MENKKFEKLSKDNAESTTIVAGTIKERVDQLESHDSEIGRKLKSVEKELDKY